MNDIDHYLDQACRHVNGPDSLKQHLRKELQEHLKEAIDALVAKGWSRDEATAKAIEELGEPEIIRDGMQAVYGPGITSLFVDQALKWKDKRWHLAAQIGLVLIVVLAFLFTGFAMEYILPRLQYEHAEHGVGVPYFLQVTISVWEIGWKYWYLGPPILLVAGGLFEWKCNSENKTLIRTFILVGVSLLSVCGAFWVAIAFMVASALLPV